MDEERGKEGELEGETTWRREGDGGGGCVWGYDLWSQYTTLLHLAGFQFGFFGGYLKSGILSDVLNSDPVGSNILSFCVRTYLIWASSKWLPKQYLASVMIVSSEQSNRMDEDVNYSSELSY